MPNSFVFLIKMTLRNKKRLNGVIHSYDLTKESVHDIKYLDDIKPLYHNCCIIGDRDYISKEVQLDLFETANIRLECPYRHNQKDYKQFPHLFSKSRKRIETLFFQLVDQMMVIRNSAKQSRALFGRIISKISAMTFAQYVNFINDRPIGQIKYAFF